jgi:flagellar L-ring protein precursor FlgH
VDHDTDFFTKEGSVGKGEPMNTKTTIFCVLTLLLCVGRPVQAGSIWAKRDSNMRTLYADDVARNIGDILTIVITEDSKVDNTAKRDLQKETARSSDFDGRLDIEDIISTMPGLTMEATSASELSAQADYQDERTFEDEVTVVVVDILPNGNLVVAGTRDRNIAGDVQKIEISGIVRPSDITFGNTVASAQVANFQVVTKNGGIAAPYTRTGWLTRVFDILWPW